MAQAKTPTAPAVLTGAALLAAIADGSVTRITTEQAASLDASHIEVNTADVVDGGAAVRLTDAGKAAVPAPATAVKAADISIDDDVAMPTTRRRAPTEAVYPFDKLEKVGQSFHVPKTAANPDPAVRLSSSVSGARVRFTELLTNTDGTPKMESYTRVKYQMKDGGGYALNAEGKRVTLGKETAERQARSEPTRDFQVVSVGADDPRGEGARVFRTK